MDSVAESLDVSLVSRLKPDRLDQHQMAALEAQEWVTEWDDLTKDVRHGECSCKYYQEEEGMNCLGTHLGNYHVLFDCQVQKPLESFGFRFRYMSVHIYANVQHLSNSKSSILT